MEKFSPRCLCWQITFLFSFSNVFPAQHTLRYMRRIVMPNKIKDKLSRRATARFFKFQRAFVSKLISERKCHCSTLCRMGVRRMYMGIIPQFPTIVPIPALSFPVPANSTFKRPNRRNIPRAKKHSVWKIKRVSSPMFATRIVSGRSMTISRSL